MSLNEIVPVSTARAKRSRRRRDAPPSGAPGPVIEPTAQPTAQAYGHPYYISFEDRVQEVRDMARQAEAWGSPPLGTVLARFERWMEVGDEIKAMGERDLIRQFLTWARATRITGFLSILLAVIAWIDTSVTPDVIGLLALAALAAWIGLRWVLFEYHYQSTQC